MSKNLKKSNIVSVIIEEDECLLDENELIENEFKAENNDLIENEFKAEITPSPQKKKRTRQIQPALSTHLSDNPLTIELGIDEVGRGPLFGRVYASAVVLPNNDSFDHSKMKDSKKFHSKSKIQAVSEYIKTNAIAWSVKYESEDTIDEINILQATQQAMHQCVKDVLNQLKIKYEHDGMEFNLSNILLLVDGNYFKPYTHINKTMSRIQQIKHVTVEQGDNKYTSIAAASILAKVERDEYIAELCEENPELKERYKIDSNKGYGAKCHIDGIKQWGITQWHRKTFGICKNFA